MKNQFNNNSASNIEAKQFLDQMDIDYTENKKTGEITVGDVYIQSKGLTKLPDLTMVIIKGNFNCQQNQLTTLEGAPQKIDGGFQCDGNKLTTLAGAPQTVGGAFSCTYNLLTDLIGAPQNIVGAFSCYNNQLTTLEGAPQTVGNNFSCYHNKLTSLKGAPQSVGGGFYCDSSPELKYSEPYDQYWISPSEIKSIQQISDKKMRAKKIADFRRFAKARRKTI